MRRDYLSHAQESGTSRCAIQNRANMIARTGVRARARLHEWDA